MRWGQFLRTEDREEEEEEEEEESRETAKYDEDLIVLKGGKHGKSERAAVREEREFLFQYLEALLCVMAILAAIIPEWRRNVRAFVGHRGPVLLSHAPVVSHAARMSVRSVVGCLRRAQCLRDRMRPTHSRV